MKIKRDRVYCYVTKDGAAPMRAAKKGSEVDGKPVFMHSDYTPWIYGKPTTKAMCGQSGWRGAAAKAVCFEMGWKSVWEA